MSERIDHVSTPDGPMETFIATPSVALQGRIILYMDVWGVRDELRAIANNVASHGFLCALPDLYHREGRVRHCFADEQGRMRSLLSLTPEEQEQVRGPMRRLSDDMAMADTHALLAHLDADDAPVAAVGYCMGGRHALLAGGLYPDAVRAAACLHGSNLVSGETISPHRIAARIRGEAYCGFAEKDPFAAKDVVDALVSAFRDAGSKLTYRIHRNAQHGYALPERDVYNDEAARRDWAEIFAMIARVSA
jgi:carboxymethylenebutenolidase